MDMKLTERLPNKDKQSSANLEDLLSMVCCTVPYFKLYVTYVCSLTLPVTLFMRFLNYFQSLKELLVLGERYNSNTSIAAQKINRIMKTRETVKSCSRKPFSDLNNTNACSNLVQKTPTLTTATNSQHCRSENSVWSKEKVIRRRHLRKDTSPLSPRPKNRKRDSTQNEKSLWKNVIKNQHGRRCKNLL